MAEVLPFIGTRYNSQLIEDLSQVLSPPYDVINEEKQKLYYHRHPYNIIRLILGQDHPADDEYNNKYIRAANYFQTWKCDSILVNDHRKSLYCYEQEFWLPSGEKRTRQAFFALVKLEDYNKGGIRGHELTYSGPKADRLKLLRATKTNFSPIFVLYFDGEKQIEAILQEEMTKPSWVQAQDNEGVKHRLWVVPRQSTIKKMQELMRDKRLFIADGHHRYETALMYRDEMREATVRCDGKQPFDYMLMCLSNFDAQNLIILPTHRVLSRELGIGIETKEVLGELRHYFCTKRSKVNFAEPERSVQQLLNHINQEGEKTTSLAMVFPNGTAYCLKLKDGINIDNMIENDLSGEIKQLDVTILHNYIINQAWLGNPEMEIEDNDIYYTRDPLEALSLLKAKKGSVAFLMNATRLPQVKNIISKGLLMPPKSTYFYPKIITGLVLRDMTVN